MIGISYGKRERKKKKKTTLPIFPLNKLRTNMQPVCLHSRLWGRSHAIVHDRWPL